MRQVRRKPAIGVALGALPLVLATGCSFSFGGPGSVDADQVAQRSSEMLAEQIGQAPDEFTCPEDLPAEVGAEVRCELTHGGESLGVTVTTTSVDGDNVQWDVQVDETPAGDTAAEDDTAAEEGGAAQDDAAEETAAADNATAVASDGQVSATEVVEQSTAALQAAGRSPQNFACTSSHLRAEVGAEMSCNFFEDGVLHNVTVATTSVDGGTVTWDIRVDESQ
ncbi:hypothetical protein A6A08_12655 [Nocardiopsis sp. TSRI0078]|uniref:DUF4333 domain-containing protein n=1 Tax=unclassified Nocardiopsis TaxID=2649073 RepID=UPI0009396E96|nr:DUF4333 domain-containing protein [Nocardiopsis sp. TSRI0078]OKI14431.1 hypothetical protein A6A08_12655 [Nocardiopsis sp. TSRI0078]